MTLELATRSRLRAARARRFTAIFATGLLSLVALTLVLPAAIGLSFRSVTDDAMSGTMDKGSAVIVDSVPVADLAVGDVITYPTSAASPTSSLVTRRIAEIDAGAIRTSGDNTGALDPWTVTLTDSTQEVAVGHVPFAGYVVDALDGSLRIWLAGALTILIGGLAVTGVLATKREEARVAAAPMALDESDEIPEPVRVPTPRHTPRARRDSTV